jgi:hypothetical protein
MHLLGPQIETHWRVWLLPGDEHWQLASGAEMKQRQRQARKATLDAGQYARLQAGTLALSEPLEQEPERLETAA